MEVVLKRMGNSTALIVPPPVLKELGMAVGQRLGLTTTVDGRIVLTPKHKFVLADLIAQCDPKARPPADLQAWDASHRVGQEVL